MATSFADLDQRQQWIVVGVLCALGLLIFYMQVWSGNAERIVELEGEIQQLEAEVREMEVVAANLPEIQDEIGVLRERLQVLRHILPEEYETDSLLRGLGTLASRSNLDLLDLEFEEPVPHEFYAESPIELEVTGGFHDLGRFFDRIGKFARIINVDDVTIEAASESQDTVVATITAVTFIFLEDAPRDDDDGEEEAAP